ncbi:hypothetical protein BJ508DRAFT_336206 [Ascobolus immersus RN42]|uniref:Uncharacterized protein n=1 Tax=Ascobolus immersus RN42 TaxID=1160509 RepID=A0A3N4H9F0_ASCIM|nr:hypothetical protein BJ508DRAFT_336206 [Ascobolus immersus RN42]
MPPNKTRNSQKEAAEQGSDAAEVENDETMLDDGENTEEEMLEDSPARKESDSELSPRSQRLVLSGVFPPTFETFSQRSNFKVTREDYVPSPPIRPSRRSNRLSGEEADEVEPLFFSSTPESPSSQKTDHHAVASPSRTATKAKAHAIHPSRPIGKNRKSNGPVKKTTKSNGPVKKTTSTSATAATTQDLDIGEGSTTPNDKGNSQREDDQSAEETPVGRRCICDCTCSCVYGGDQKRKPATSYKPTKTRLLAPLIAHKEHKTPELYKKVKDLTAEYIRSLEALAGKDVPLDCVMEMAQVYKVTYPQSALRQKKERRESAFSYFKKHVAYQDRHVRNKPGTNDPSGLVDYTREVAKAWRRNVCINVIVFF